MDGHQEGRVDRLDGTEAGREGRQGPPAEEGGRMGDRSVYYLFDPRTGKSQIVHMGTSSFEKVQLPPNVRFDIPGQQSPAGSACGSRGRRVVDPKLAAIEQRFRAGQLDDPECQPEPEQGDYDEEDYDDEEEGYADRHVAKNPAHEYKVKGLSRWPEEEIYDLLDPKKMDSIGDTVQDCIRSLIDLLDQSLSAAQLAAALDYKLAATNADVAKAKPVQGHHSVASLKEMAEEMSKSMKGPDLFSAKAKQFPAARVKMPPLLLAEVHTFLIKVAQFSCSFSPEAALAWGANAVAIGREIAEMKKTVNHRGSSMSVKNATQLLEDLQQLLEEKMQEAIKAAQQKQKAAAKAMRTLDDKRPRPAGGPYAARERFQKNGNPHQEKADMGEKKRKLLDDLSQNAGPEHDDRRKNFLRRRLCKWHLAGNCDQGDTCRFAHLSSAELQQVGVTVEEARASFPPAGRN